MALRTLSGLGLPEPAPLPELEHTIVAEPIEAWRVWRVARPDTLTFDRACVEAFARAYDEGRNPFRGLFDAQLVALAHESSWAPGATTAVCNASNYAPFHFVSRHESPGLGCSCGMWALKNERDVWRTIAEYDPSALGGVYAYGRVRLWGRVIEHDRGYRAQHARPKTVALVAKDDSLAAELAARYGCPVDREPERPEIVEAKAELRAERQKAMETDPHFAASSMMAALSAPRSMPKKRKFRW